MRRIEGDDPTIISKRTQIPFLDGSLSFPYPASIDQQSVHPVTIQLEPKTNTKDSLLQATRKVSASTTEKLGAITKRYDKIQNEVTSLSLPEETKAELTETLSLWQADTMLTAIAKDTTEQSPFYINVKQLLLSSDTLHPLEKLRRTANATPEAPQLITSLLEGSPLLVDIGLRVLSSTPQWHLDASIQEALGNVAVKASYDAEDAKLGSLLIDQAKRLYRGHKNS